MGLAVRNPLRGSSVLFAFLGTAALMLGATFLHAHTALSGRSQVLARNQAVAEQLQLTDLCLFTEARYTRHPSQADIHTPFQDHPTGLDHFPSASLLSPPRTLFIHHGPMGR